MKNFDFVSQYIRKYRKNTYLGIMFSILSVIFVLLLPQITTLFIDSVYAFANADPNKISVFWFFLDDFFTSFTLTGLVCVLCLLFIICSFLKFVTSYFATKNFFIVSNESCGDIRSDCFKKLAFIDRNKYVNEAFFNFTNDINDYYDLVYKTYPKLITLPFTVLFSIVLSFFIDWRVALCFVAGIPIILGLGWFFSRSVVKSFFDARSRKSILMTKSEEFMNEMYDIKIFGNEEYAINIFNKLNASHSKVSCDSNKQIHYSNFWLNVVRAICLTLTLVAASIACFNGVLTVGYFVLIVAYAFYAINGVVRFVQTFFEMQVNMIGVSGVRKFLHFKSTINDLPEKNIENPEIKFVNVGVNLNGRVIFKDLNLELEDGKSYGVIIPQGEGKTAFAKILLRFLMPTSGEYTISGENVQNININSIRNCFSYVSQEPYIFEDTVLNNIIMFDELDENRLDNAINICQLSDLIAKLPDGIQTKLTERGNGLSSQDKQKINFARAIYKNSQILLLDSPFNKFDKRFSKNLLEKCVEFYKDKTIVLLSEVIDEVKNLSKVYYVNNHIMTETTDDLKPDDIRKIENKTNKKPAIKKLQKKEDKNE